MIESITLKCRNDDADTMSFDPRAVTIVVGPNSSGKTLLLNELSRSFTRNAQSRHYHILDELVIDNELLQNPHRYVREFYSKSENGNWHIRNGAFHKSIGNLHEDNVDHYITRNARSINIWEPLVQFLASGECRNLASDGGRRSPSGDGPTSLLQYLTENNEVLKQYEKMVKQAIGVFPVVDATLGALHMRYSQDEIPGEHYLSMKSSAQKFMQSLPSCQQLSDGLRSYIGIVLAVLAGESRLTIIDEPETFLHPPLQHVLGKQIVEMSSTYDGCLVVATHSASVLAGCVAGGVDVNVLRLNREGESTSAKLLPPSDVSRIATNPLLRASSALESLFCTSAVICEGPSDCAVYAEINQRLMDDTSQSIEDAKWISAFTLSEVPYIMKSLRSMGVPAAAIVDIDAIVTAPVFKKLLNNAGMPVAERNALFRLRDTIMQEHELEDKSKPWKKQGVDWFKSEYRSSVWKLLTDLGDYGLFVVPCGALEQWHETGAGKSSFVSEYMKYLGSDKSAKSYQRPDKGGIWDFVRNIAKWTRNHERKGMSSYR